MRDLSFFESFRSAGVQISVENQSSLCIRTLPQSESTRFDYTLPLHRWVSVAIVHRIDPALLLEKKKVVSD